MKKIIKKDAIWNNQLYCGEDSSVVGNFRMVTRYQTHF